MENLCSINTENYKHTVLVIDDSRLILQYMKTLLTKLNFNVIVADDGFEGVKSFSEHNPDIVLIDLEMPGMDGFTVCSILRNMDTKSTLIYMVTSSKDEASINAAFKVGFNDYFTKPVLESLFVAKIQKDLNEKSVYEIKYAGVNNSNTLENQLDEARALQMSLLPKPIINEVLSVKQIYSPYSGVSGDFVDYWWDDQEKMLYGYLFDVAGHSIASAMQVFAIRMLFCQNRKYCSDVDELLYYTNSEMFKNKQRPSMVTAIAFKVDIRKQVLHFSSAGISPFYLNGKPFATRGYPLGYKKTAIYELNTVSLESISDIVFCTDGYSELVTKSITSNQDDVSIIMIQNLKEVNK